MIIKLNRKEWNDGRTNATIVNEVKKRLNGETPKEIICETISLTDSEVEIRIKI